MFGGVPLQRFTVPAGFMNMSCMNTQTMRKRSSDVRLNDTTTGCRWKNSVVFMLDEEAKALPAAPVAIS
eukprot:9245317-Prorocentrum_lima.AAC.1